MSVSAVKSRVQAASNKIYEVGGRHVAGQHSLSIGEIAAILIAGAMIYAPALFKSIPLVGKYASVTVAFAILIVAMIFT